MAIIVEQITRNKKVLSYHKSHNDKVRIGRAYDNDVVLQEEHVSPYHAEIDLNEGALVLTDLNSLNGIKTRHNGKVSNSISVQSGDIFTLGKRHIRVLKASHQVAPAKQLSVLEDIASRLNQWYFAALALIAFWSVMMAYNYLTRFDAVVWSKEAAKYSLFTLALVVFPMLIAVSARFFKKEVRFFASLVLSFGIFTLFQFTTTMAQWLYFNWPESLFSYLFSEVTELGLLTALFWGAFYLASNMTMKKITLASFGLVAVIWGLTFYSKQSTNIQVYPSSYAVVFPSQFLLAQAEPVPQQNKVNQALFSQASKEADNLNKETND